MLKQACVFAVSILSLGLGQSAFAGGDLLPMQTFTSSAQGWTSGGSNATWSATNGYLSCGSGSGTNWISPEFAVTPGQYYQVQYSVKGSSFGQIGCFGANPSATYDLENTASAINYPAYSGQLLWDNYTTTPPSPSGWTTVTRYIQAQPNATEAFMQFNSQTTTALSSGTLGSTIQIDNVQVSSATAAQAAAWALSQQATFAQPIPYSPPKSINDSRFANIGTFMQKLTSGQNVTIGMLGDSIQNDTENSMFNTLLEARYGGQVNFLNAGGHGTGMSAWDVAPYTSPATGSPANLNLTTAIINQHPDLVILGGISNSFGGSYQAGGSTTSANYLATLDVINKIKAGSPNTQILLMTGAEGTQSNGTTSNPPASFDPNINNLSTTDDRRMLQSLAATAGVGFFDLTGAWGQYCVDLTADGQSRDLFHRDTTHANDLGRQMLAEAMYNFFLVPEPSSLCLLGLAALGLLAGRVTRRRTK